MWSREKRLLAVALLVAGVALGVGLEALADPLEEQGLAWLVLLVGMLVSGGAVAHWASRRFEESGEIDERFREIERRASRWSHGTLTVGVGTLGLVVLVSWIEVPVAAVLWALLAGSVAVHELSVEYYSRQM
jgi:uncharacterized membrane protein